MQDRIYAIFTIKESFLCINIGIFIHFISKICYYIEKGGIYLKIYILIGVLILIAIYVLVTYNSLVRLNNSVKEAFATMDVYLKKRWDLIPNLVETVKGYAKHEKETLQSVINLRNSIYDDMSQNEKIEANEKINSGISKIIALAESYPDLKANQNFLNLSNQLSKIEEDIANSRKYYNAVVKNMNNKILMFPSNIVAKIFGYKELKMFEAQKSERENVRIEL